MAKKKLIHKTDNPVEKTPKLIVNQISVTSANRSRKDIADIKTALQSAESVHVPNRVLMYDLYDDVVLDGTVEGLIGKREDAVLNKTLRFVDASKKKVDEMDKLIESENFRKLVKGILATKGWGITGFEFIPGAEFRFKDIPRKHIKPHKKIIANYQNDEVGFSYDGVSNLWVLGDENDFGYLLKCAFYAVYKRGGLGDLAQFVEIFGQPVRIIYYDANDQKTKAELRTILDESGSSLALMIPNQAKFEMMDGKQTNGDGSLQIKFISYLDDELSIIILGNTETTRSSSSSGYAQSKTHEKQQIAKTKGDLKYVVNMLNDPHFILILKSYGYSVEGGMFEFEKEIDLEELKLRAETEKVVFETHPDLPVDHDYLYETYGIPKPKNYDELIAKKEAERQLKLNPPAPDQDDPGKPKPPAPKGKPQPDKTKPGLRQKLNAWDNLLAHVADFFDQARS